MSQSNDNSKTPQISKDQQECIELIAMLYNASDPVYAQEVYRELTRKANKQYHRVINGHGKVAGIEIF